MKLIELLIRGIQRIFSRKTTPKPNMTPKQIVGKGKAKKKEVEKDQSKQSQSESKPDQDNFFTERLEAEGSKPMRKFIKKHKHRLRNQDPDVNLDQGIDR